MEKRKKKQIVLSVAWKGNKVYERFCSTISSRYNLTQNEIDVLAFLRNFREINTAKEISRYRVISKSLVCKSVKSLIARDFLRSEADAEDKRVQHLYITEKAEAACDEIISQQESFINILYDGVTPEEDRVLTNILARITGNLDEYIEKHADK